MFRNGLLLDTLVDSRANVSAIAQNELDRNKQQTPANSIEIDDLPNFQIQVANGQLEKPLGPTTFNIDIGDQIFAQHFVLMKNLTEPIMGSHSMRLNSVVINNTHGLFLFPYLTMQVKSAADETSAKPQNVLADGAATTPAVTTKTS